jgi:hypothetical protein
LKRKIGVHAAIDYGSQPVVSAQVRATPNQSTGCMANMFSAGRGLRRARKSGGRLWLFPLSFTFALLGLADLRATSNQAMPAFTRSDSKHPAA